MLIDELSINLIKRTTDNILEYCHYLGFDLDNKDINIIEYIDSSLVIDQKFDLCVTLDTIQFYFSTILTEVRQNKRNITTSIFSDNPKIAQEKSVLKEKLDSFPEYACIHKLEEMLFQYIEYIGNLKNNIVYLYKEDDNV